MRTLSGSLVLAALLGLGGCNSMTATAVDSIKLAVKGKVNTVPPERADNPRADTLLVSAGAAEALYVAPRNSSGQIQWRGITEQLETDGGRITQLLGMPIEVLAPLEQEDPLREGLMTLPNGTQVTRYVDYPLSYQTGLTQQATYTHGPLETMNIFGRSQTLQRIDEQIWMPQIKYSAVNYYWVDPATGGVRRSLQYLAPGLPAFDLIFTHQRGAAQ
jgi:hypothetical protein